MAVLTQSNPSFSKLELIQVGTTSFTKAASDNFNDVEITHNLGFVPVVLAFANVFTDRYELLPYTEFDLSSGAMILHLTIQQISSSGLEFSVSAPSGGSYFAQTIDIPVRYYLLRDSAK